MSLRNEESNLRAVSLSRYSRRAKYHRYIMGILSLLGLFLFKLKYSLDSEKSDEMIIPKHLEKTLIEQIELELKNLLEYYTSPGNRDLSTY